MLDRANGSWQLPDMKRVVVAIDPSGTKGEEEDSGDSIGIVVAGLGADGFGYVLADKTVQLSPDGASRVAVKAYQDFKADRIIAERNFGGAMVERHPHCRSQRFLQRSNSLRGKIARAEPVSALYEQSRVRHAGAFTELEDQMAAMTSEGCIGFDGSPDRCDALVWALTELMVTGPPPMTFAPPIVVTKSDPAPHLNPATARGLFMEAAAASTFRFWKFKP